MMMKVVPYLQMVLSSCSGTHDLKLFNGLSNYYSIVMICGIWWESCHIIYFAIRLLPWKIEFISLVSFDKITNEL